MRHFAENTQALGFWRKPKVQKNNKVLTEIFSSNALEWKKSNPKTLYSIFQNFRNRSKATQIVKSFDHFSGTKHLEIFYSIFIKKQQLLINGALGFQVQRHRFFLER